MVSSQTARELALAFDEVTEEPHFDKTSFKVKKKIFATMNGPEKRMTLKLTPLDQDVFCTFDKNVIYPVPNAWGKQGWTHANLRTIRKDMLQDILTVAYCTVAPKKLADKYRVE
ncbi:MAG: MmcQ/YjbR family DNA-binding protein [Chitinophagaceae bacterium]|nr:MmcQ/YjbR family DNA-binding protein [Chitinophagaceae bacterium]MCB9045490.1 MmcQ/YjbR family DNA-binding protein [Chitinophagales bacterium]